MEEIFYDFLTECIGALGSKSAPVDIPPEVWQEFCADNAPEKSRPVQPEPPPVREVAPAPVPVAPPTPPPVSGVPVGSMDMGQLAAAVKDCHMCRLCEGRTNTVFGEGNLQTRLMFIGEGPGADEDRTGRPFVGKAGQLLDKMIAAMKFAREEVYIANVVKCRPPGNRAPTPDEAAACIGYLKRQIALIKPDVIVCLGGVALSFLLNETVGITRMRGNWLSFDGIPVMPTFHPAYLLRQESAKRDAWSDLKQVMRALGKL